MNTEFIRALDEIEREKKIPKDVIFEALEKALIKSYEKNFDDKGNVRVELNRETGDIKVFAVKEVVEDVEDKVTEMALEEALLKDPALKLGDQISVEVTPRNFGRIAAQTARNIVIQKIKDAERDVIYEEFVDREKEIITGLIQRIDFNNIYINLGKAEAMIPPSEQVATEKYKAGTRLKVYIAEVRNTSKGAQIILSRSNPGLVIRLFELEVPEINDGTVEIYSIAREAGSRTKLAVFSKEPGVDSVGACVGFKGARVNSIVEELQGEKIDIIVWDKDVKTFIANALSPAEVMEVIVSEKEKSARVIVPDDQLSLAIGKEGQNARLAAKLTGWKIDIKGAKQHAESLEGLKKEDEEVLEVEEIEEVNDMEESINE